MEQLKEWEPYLYKQSYDRDKKEIRFSKLRHETGETVAQNVYDGLTRKKKE